MPYTTAQAVRAIEHYQFPTDSSKTAVVVGGTTGIGEEVAILLAKLGCARVIIFGRNASRGEAVLDKMRTVGHKGRYEYVQGDLGDTKSMRSSADVLQRALGTGRIDYLFMLQNGVPSGGIKENADGDEVGFAVQALSRFALAYIFTTEGVLAPNAVVLSIANPGLSLDDLDVEDLSLKKRLADGRSKALFFFDQSKRDSTVIDAFVYEMNIRYPQFRYLHLHPGLVKTKTVNKVDFPVPFPWSIIFPLGYALVSQTPEQFAPVPVYLAVHPSSQKELGDSKYFNHKLTPLSLGKWGQDPRNREALWEKLKLKIGL